jgi:DNA-binding response OmpR family regulator
MRVDAQRQRDSASIERLFHRSGEEGIDLAKLYDYDIILAGPEPAGHDRARGSAPVAHRKVKTPILILSGLDDPEEQAQGLRLRRR